MKKKLIFLFLISLLLPLYLSAQEKQVSGKVIDADIRQLIGMTCYSKIIPTTIG